MTGGTPSASRRAARPAPTATARGTTDEPAERAWSDLQAGLADAGVALADVESVVVTHWHVDGETVAGATVWHTPGHTEGQLAVVTGDEAFVGDTVLSTYTPNVGGGDTRADDPIPAYAEALERLASTTRTLRPGHGTTVDPDRIAVIRAHHRERSQNVLAAVAGAEPASPWTVARQLFGEMNGIHAKFGAGEAAAHLQWLAAAGAVSTVSGSPRRYGSAADVRPERTHP